MNTAYLAGGCFWCITPDLRDLPGVQQVVSGYCGGDEASPTYEDVKHQRTMHRETVAVTYDPQIISYREILDCFLRHVDPFDPDGQFIDRGHSYTLAIYPSSEDEATQAREALNMLQNQDPRPVCIAVEPYKVFWPAEEYHQNYDLKNPEAFHHELVESGRLKE